MRSLELFSGCGGLAKGLELSGFQHCGFVESNKWACASLRENFDPSLVHETDVRKFDFKSVGEVDLIAGGPPCQPFSLGGLAKAFDDARDMFPEAIRAIHELKPKGFIFENVKGLLRSSFADYFSYIILRLTYPDEVLPAGMLWRDHLSQLELIDPLSYIGLKYEVTYKLMNAVDYGVPQNRERVFIVGFRKDLHANFSWPCPMEERRTIADVIGDLPPPDDGIAIEDHVFVPGAREYNGHTGSDYHAPSKTIKAGAHGVPGGENMIRFPDGRLRYMTVHEAKLIQTFPSDYRICGAWGEAMRQIGNAVPVNLAYVVGSAVIDSLNHFPDGTNGSSYRLSNRKKIQREPVQMTLLEPSVYVVGKSPLTLFASYRRDCKEWIVKNGLYNYPVTRRQFESDGRFARAERLILRNRNGRPMCFSVKGCEFVTRKQLEKLGYPRQGTHAHYLLFRIEPADDFAVQMREGDFSVLVGKGCSYDEFIRAFPPPRRAKANAGRGRRKQACHVSDVQRSVDCIVERCHRN